MEQEYKVKSLVKVFKILECFSTAQPELGITEISRMLDIQKSTVHNIADTCQQLGYLVQNKETGKYSLGVKFLQFSYIINTHMGLRKFFLPYIQRISQELNETVFLGIPHENEVLYIECCHPTDNLGTRSILGEHAPMYCTGLGKAMLAFLPREKQEEYTSMPLQRYTPNTIVEKEQLLEDLAQVRTQGYSMDNMEHEFGVTCIGMPIFSHDNTIVAAISVSAPSLRFDDETIKRSAVQMKAILAPAQHQL